MLDGTQTSDCPGRHWNDADGVGMFFQLTALMFSCFGGSRRLTVIVTVTANINMLYAHRSVQGADPQCVCVCVCMYVCCEFQGLAALNNH